ncbi:MAG: gliding motility protein GldM [Bacteroidia bacterium]
MASAKLPPRQKMIGMMYLVLTAILALNVSKDILDAFVTVNTGLVNTGKTFDADITTLYDKFNEKKTIDPLRVMNSWKKAQQAKKMSIEMNTWIDQLKKQIIRETEGFKAKEEDTINLQYVSAKDNYDIPTNILCGASEDGSTGTAHELRNKLQQYKKDMLGLLSPEDQKNLHLSIETPDPTTGEHKNWEMETFYHAPLAASVTILSKIQDDVKSAEADVLNALLKETEADVIPFDTVAARVVAQSNYVLLGEEYQADIFLAAFNKTLVPQIQLGQFDPATGKMIGPSDSVPVSQGIGQYNIKTSKEGIMKYEGIINMKTPKGQIMQFPFKSEYIVARPALTVGADKMNAMYAGLENPISVSVPGIPNEKLRVTCTNGTLRPLGNGKYMVVGPRVGDSEIRVSAQMDDGTTRNMGSMPFRVKALPVPIVKMTGVTGSRATKQQVTSSLGLVSTYGADFVFDAKSRVVSFQIAIYKNGVFISDDKVQGNQYTQKQKDNFNALRRGDRILITDVKTVGADGNILTANDITVTIQ